MELIAYASGERVAAFTKGIFPSMPKRRTTIFDSRPALALHTNKRRLKRIALSVSISRLEFEPIASPHHVIAMSICCYLQLATPSILPKRPTKTPPLPE
ncbi:unnamed protein product [Periconia digitata]|uniref:Uncharacterized protein n=1 Tax=Periconia digitata TaxID=1303443 RepID=A0A9W4UV39_9PLEO|nr:unnamed protein product [Periconia digitata]